MKVALANLLVSLIPGQYFLTTNPENEFLKPKEKLRLKYGFETKQNPNPYLKK